VRGTALLAAVAAAGALTAAEPARAFDGDAVPGGKYAFTAYVEVGEQRACTGVLVDPEWVLTASSCFSDDPAQAFPVSAGAPKTATTVVVGRADLTSKGGTETQVTEIVPRQDRDVVMARLAQPVTNVDPVTLAKTPAAQGESLRLLGYGRTRDAWVTDRLHSGSFTVKQAAATTVDVASAGGRVCRGDAGGPALRENGGTVELVALNSQSWQGGCYGTDASEARTDAVEARVDDLGAWVKQVRGLPQDSQTVSGDFNGDGRTDFAGFYDNGTSVEGKHRSSLYTWLSSGTGFQAPQKQWSTPGGFTYSKSKVTSGDYNGDGKDDIAVFYDGGQAADGRNVSSVYTWYSTGTGFSAPKRTWTSSGGFTWEASKVVSGDFTGDGKTDIGVFYDRGTGSDGVARSALFTFVSTGTGFSAPSLKWESSGSFRWNMSAPTAGDYNGDGKDDVSVFYDAGTGSDGKHSTKVFTLHSTGADFGKIKTTWTSSGGFTWSRGKIESGDFDGDGKADIGILYDRGLGEDGKYGSALFTLTSSGSDFSAGLKWESSGDFAWARSQFTAGDYNGDRKADGGVYYHLGETADDRTVGGVYTWLSRGSSFNAPAARWSGPVS